MIIILRVKVFLNHNNNTAINQQFNLLCYRPLEEVSVVDAIVVVLDAVEVVDHAEDVIALEMFETRFFLLIIDII